MAKSSRKPYYYSVGGCVHLHENMDESTNCIACTSSISGKLLRYYEEYHKGFDSYCNMWTRADLEQVRTFNVFAGGGHFGQ